MPPEILIPKREEKAAPPPQFAAAFYKDSGEVAMVSTCPDEDTAERLAGELELNWLRDAPTDVWCYVEDDTFVPMPSQPSREHVFDWTVKEWVDPRTLEDLRATAWARIKVARAAALAGGAEVQGIGRFDADSAAALNMTATLAALPYQPSGWTVTWTLFDNSAAVLDKTTFPLVASTVLAHGDAVHQIGRALRAELEASTTPEAIAAVVWPL